MREKTGGALRDGFRLTNWRSIIRPRTIVYFVVWAGIGLAMLTALSLRTPVSVSVLHDRNPLYVVMRDGSISNGYDVKVLNMTPAQRTVTVSIEGLDGAGLSIPDHENKTLRSVELSLDPDEVTPLRAYVQLAPADLPQTQAHFTFVVQTGDGTIRSETAATFEVPESRK